MLETTATWCYRHRLTVVLLWLVAAAGLTVAAGSVGGSAATSARLRGTDSDRAYEILRSEAPQAAGDSVTAVFRVDSGVDDPAARRAIEGFLTEIGDLPGVAGIVSPYDAPDQVSADRRTAYASLAVADGEDAAFEASVPAITDRASTLEGAGVTAAFGGGFFQEGGVPSTEALGILGAMVILVLAFGSVVIMGLPIVTALIGVAATVAGVGLWAAVVPTPDFTTTVAAMIGIGVGIDYALFIITRARTAMARLDPQDAVREASRTAGRAVVLAGGTVVVSLLGMLLIGLDFLQGLALGTASAVAIAVLAASTLLPALLGFTKGRLAKRARRDVAKAGRETTWHRWSRFVQRHPVGTLVAGGVVMVALAAPALTMRLASADEGNDPVGTSTRTAYDLLASGFGPGFNGPLLVVAETPTPEARASLGALRAAVQADAGVAEVGPVTASPSGRAALLVVVPTTGPQDRATEQLVHRLRHEVMGSVAPGSGLSAHIGGATASSIDFSTILGARLPLFIGAVLLVSFLLLALVFRSVLVPLKAVLLNLLSIGAAYGAMVMVFQWGWFGSLLGVGPGAPIEPWAPMMLFAIVFGLSMDYEVFLLSSIKERYDRTHDNDDAVVEGLASTARVITAAAAIMVLVFGGFVMSDMRAVKLIGFGLAIAVLLDATLVRMVLVPSTMTLLGDRNWWLPRWLDRLLPRFAVEGHEGDRRPAGPAYHRPGVAHDTGAAAPTFGRSLPAPEREPGTGIDGIDGGAGDGVAPARLAANRSTVGH